MQYIQCCITTDFASRWGGNYTWYEHLLSWISYHVMVQNGAHATLIQPTFLQKIYWAFAQLRSESDLLFKQHLRVVPEPRYLWRVDHQYPLPWEFIYIPVKLSVSVFACLELFPGSSITRNWHGLKFLVWKGAKATVCSVLAQHLRWCCIATNNPRCPIKLFLHYSLIVISQRESFAEHCSAAALTVHTSD